MGEALANYCLSASINSYSPHKRCMCSMAERAETGLSWHTLLIKEVNAVCAQLPRLCLCSEFVGKRAAELSSAVDKDVYLSFILLGMRTTDSYLMGDNVIFCNKIHIFDYLENPND